MLFLLDTSALLAHYRKEAGWEKVQSIFEKEDDPVLIASISVAEFARRLNALGVEENVTLQTLAGYRFLCEEVVAVDENIARKAFEISVGTPSRLPLADSLIAACACVRGAVLVHRDEHMLPIPSGFAAQEYLASH